MGNIKFGTDGWRAVVGKDFNEENVRKVSNAIGKYVLNNFGLQKRIIIGYDPRNMAKEFSTLTAEILRDFGFEVLYSGKVVPTPVLAYSAQYLDACAIMFTASHNPPEYLGIKFIPDYAGPATEEITNEIVSYLEYQPEQKKQGQIKIIDFSDAYFEHIEKLVDIEKIKNLKETIIFDGLYSATIGYFDTLLKKHKIPFKSLHMFHDPNFGGGMPEPKPQFMKESIEEVKQLGSEVAKQISHCEEQSDEAFQPSFSNLNSTPQLLDFLTAAIALANDGDGDRFGVINEEGEYVSPNEIIAILLMHLKKNKKMSGSIVKTVGASLLLNKVAEKLGVEVVETAVGFKHVGEAMRKYNPIIGGEESGGLSIQGHIPEKDGILANLLILEAMAYENKSLVELQKDLYDFAGCKFYTDRIDKKLESTAEIQPVLEKYKNIKNLDEFSVSRTDTKDGVKIYFDDNTSWILIRPSGTEPLLRIYFESDNKEKIEKLKEKIFDKK